MTTAPAYSFDNHDPEASTQLPTLEAILDPVSTARLAALDLPPAPRCWEVGAGGGSVAYWLAEQLEEDATVLATDIDTVQLESTDRVRVQQHDLRHDPLPEGPFDLIHARLVLLHLPQRRQLLDTLVSALNPGGWLLVEEFDCTAPPRVMTPSDPADVQLFDQVIKAVLTTLENGGASLSWARELHAALGSAGLTELHTLEHTESWDGGDLGCLLHQTNATQLRELLLEQGLTAAQLDHYHELMNDPTVATRFYQFVSTWGRKPDGA